MITATTTTADPNATTTTADPNATTTADPNATTTTADPNATTTNPDASTTTSPAIWEENEKIWSADQCQSILITNGVTLEQCQERCAGLSTCTAVNFGSESGHCTLLNCGYPCPEPQWTFANYKGYCLNRGK